MSYTDVTVFFQFRMKFVPFSTRLVPTNGSLADQTERYFNTVWQLSYRSFSFSFLLSSARHFWSIRLKSVLIRRGLLVDPRILFDVVT